MTVTDPTPTPGPYQTAYQMYRSAGWRGTLPLPPGKKAPPPDGWTGADADMPDNSQCWTWAEERPGANIALRLPEGVIGVDVDHYGDKHGGDVLRALEEQLGTLPPTWRVTSRDDGVSGIRLYRVPPGLRWPGILGDGIETIRHGHRYAVVWPSIHPAGGTYRWITPDGLRAVHVPTMADLPTMPYPWINHFTAGAMATADARAGLTSAQVNAFVEARGGGIPCPHMKAAMDDGVKDLAHASATGSARHDAAMKATNRIAWLTGEGHPGGGRALADVHNAFAMAVADPDREPEWDRMVEGAVDKAAAAFPEASTADPCTTPNPLIPEGTPPWQPNRPATPASTNAVSSPSNASQTPSSDWPPSPPPASPASSAAGVADSSGPSAATGPRTPSSAATAAAVDGSPSPTDSRYIPGSRFLTAPERIPTIWGRGDDVLWSRGEPLMIVGQPGVGKTTLAATIIRGLLLGGDVLGYPIEVVDDPILYLAMDRPRQIARNLARTFANVPDHILDRVVFRPGPPAADIALWPETLIGMATEIGARTIIVDSLKDAAVGLTKDEVAAGYQRARSFCMANDIDILELHHMAKRNGGDTAKAPTDLAGVYGSQWITSGAGSVIFMGGVAGDPIKTITHLKQPADVVGPLTVSTNDDGTVTLYEITDPVTILRATGLRGITAQALAAILEDVPDPSKNAVERARRRLNKMVDGGVARREDGIKGGASQTPTTWFWVGDSLIPTDHATDHAPEKSEAITNPETDHAPADPRTNTDHATDHADHADRSRADTPPYRGGGVRGDVAVPGATWHHGVPSFDLTGGREEE